MTPDIWFSVILLTIIIIGLTILWVTSGYHIFTAMGRARLKRWRYDRKRVLHLMEQGVSYDTAKLLLRKEHEKNDAEFTRALVSL